VRGGGGYLQKMGCNSSPSFSLKEVSLLTSPLIVTTSSEHSSVSEGEAHGSLPPIV